MFSGFGKKVIISFAKKETLPIVMSVKARDVSKLRHPHVSCLSLHVGEKTVELVPCQLGHAQDHLLLNNLHVAAQQPKDSRLIRKSRKI